MGSMGAPTSLRWRTTSACPNNVIDVAELVGVAPFGFTSPAQSQESTTRYPMVREREDQEPVPDHHRDDEGNGFRVSEEPDEAAPTTD